ncbi:MAG: SPOR domain-containing protein [Bacteroidales bacterium]
MIDVTAYIRELLFSHDCVILPSFGGFIGNYTPARIDSATGTFSPPVKAISFNRNLSNNDGLLISRISADRGIGYADSKRLVDEFVEDIRSRLKKGERVNFDLVGHFHNNSEGNVQFEPDRDSNYLLDSYGLGSFTREPVAGYDVTSRVTRRKDLSSRPVISRKMVWRAAIAAPFIAAMILVPLKTDLFRNNASLNPLARTEMEEIASPVTVDDALIIESTGSETVEAVMDEVVASAIEPEVASEVKDVPVSTEGAGVYFLVTGSFRAESNAIRQQKELAGKGYSAEISRASNGYYRVSATSYGTYHEASDAKRAIAADFPGTWILQK